ncbi:PREDICTED: piggyBac transposable element-derived protein 4-like isoform X2 [Dinoponera quadriceps]|uniref:PiggyBac transposable element-derived protein 4-like isoform X2 n=1 Tax=Dinoponera quadriceps TaxID=609295 RepID=A0A6P3XIY3_DINQU|nr:PREDICTED: piggyBac transposable element-derived protein 4-like isoform X2 [Dinoponera quadriceps]
MSERDGVQLLYLMYELHHNVLCCELSDEENDHVEIEHEENDEQDADEDADFDPRTEHASDDEDNKLGPRSRENSRGRRRSFLKGKDNFVWSTNAPETQEQTSMKLYQPSAKFEAKDVTTPLEAWSLLFSLDILEIIVQYTNEEIQRKRENFSYQQYYGNTDIAELKAFLGLLYFSGFTKNNHSNIEDMWSSRFGCTLYKAVMTQHRFTFLLTCLRFDDRKTRNERRAEHALAPIKEIWDLFIDNCAKYYSPSTNCTIDEQLLGFQGHFEARVYMPSKLERT